MGNDVKLFFRDVSFVAGAASIKMIPTLILPEIAFVGKSNVGKSSLINHLVRRKFLAKVSNTPGRTKQINFFTVDNKLTLVDLPGYGYAKVSHSEHKNWEKLIMHYLSSRPNLQIVCLLIDARRGIKENDDFIIKIFIDLGIKFQIIYTKSDKIKKCEIDKLLEVTKIYTNSLGLDVDVIISSTKNNTGTDDLRFNLAKYQKIKIYE